MVEFTTTIELSEEDIRNILAEWACRLRGCDAAEVTFRVNAGDPGHYADRGTSVSATVRYVRQFEDTNAE